MRLYQTSAGDLPTLAQTLLGRQAAFMTGSVITIDGGASARLGSE